MRDCGPYVTEHRFSCVPPQKPNLLTAGGKESSLFKYQPHEKMGDSHPKAHLPMSVQAEIFVTVRGKTEQRNQGK